MIPMWIWVLKSWRLYLRWGAIAVAKLSIGRGRMVYVALDPPDSVRPLEPYISYTRWEEDIIY